VLPYFLILPAASPIRHQRSRQVAGAGAGAELALHRPQPEYYNTSRITQIVGLDPGLEMHCLARAHKV
jgi:hypothetical protein